MEAFFRELPRALPTPPRAVLVVSAHWEAEHPTVMASASPPLLFDYQGFPEETYRLSWPAPGAPELARRIAALLWAHGFAPAEDGARGFDHGTFIPLMLSWPDAGVPTLQLSLLADLDPARHLALGRALAPLRDEGVLIIGSGMSFHNMRLFGRADARQVSETFDAWLTKSATATPVERDNALEQWATAPAGRQAHPREEHLLPLLVVAGAAGADAGKLTFNGTFADARVSAFQFG